MHVPIIEGEDSPNVRRRSEEDQRSIWSEEGGMERGVEGRRGRSNYRSTNSDAKHAHFTCTTGVLESSVHLQLVTLAYKLVIGKRPGVHIAKAEECTTPIHAPEYQWHGWVAKNSVLGTSVTVAF